MSRKAYWYGLFAIFFIALLISLFLSTFYSLDKVVAEHKSKVDPLYFTYILEPGEDYHIHIQSAIEDCEGHTYMKSLIEIIIEGYLEINEYVSKSKSALSCEFLSRSPNNFYMDFSTALGSFTESSTLNVTVTNIEHEGKTWRTSIWVYKDYKENKYLFYWILFGSGAGMSLVMGIYQTYIDVHKKK